MAATTAVINKFTTITNSDCAENRITPSTHIVASITTMPESENRVGTSVEVPSTPPRFQNYAPETLGGKKEPRPHAKSTYRDCLHYNLILMRCTIVMVREVHGVM